MSDPILVQRVNHEQLDAVKSLVAHATPRLLVLIKDHQANPSPAHDVRWMLAELEELASYLATYIGSLRGG